MLTAALLPACGGDASNPPPFLVNAIAPDTYVGGPPTSFDLDVSGLPGEATVGSTLTVRFLASAGTPFAGGTSAEVDAVGTVVSATKVTGAFPATASTADATVTLLTPLHASVPPGPTAHLVRNDPPVAGDDAYAAIGNVSLVVDAAAGLLADDADPDGDTLTVMGFQSPADQGGSVAVEADGGFRYDPPTGFEGTDTFTYTVTDGSWQDVAVVTITVSGTVWFVDAAAAPGGDGRKDAPFDSIAALSTRQGRGGAADPAEGDTIFVHAAAAPYDGPLTLLDGQTLLGQGVDLVAGGGVLVPASSRPVLRANGGDALVLDEDAVVRGIDVENLAGGGISRPASLAGGTVTIADASVTTTGGAAFTSRAWGTSYDVALDDVTVDASAAGGLVVEGGSGSLEVTGSLSLRVTGGTLAPIDLRDSAVDASFAEVDVVGVLDAIELGGYGGSFACVGGDVTAGREILRASNARGPALAPARIEVSGCRLTAGGLAFRLGAATGTDAAGEFLEVLILDNDLAASMAGGVLFESDLTDDVTYVARIEDNRFPAHGDVDLHVGETSTLHATIVNNVASLGTLRNVVQGGTFHLDIRENAFAVYELAAASPGGPTGIVVDPGYLVRNASDVEFWITLVNTGEASITDFESAGVSGFFDATATILVP